MRFPRNEHLPSFLFRYPMIGSKIGDTVYIRRNLKGDRNVGIIQYIGPVDGLGEDSVYYGVELIVSVRLC